MSTDRHDDSKRSTSSGRKVTGGRHILPPLTPPPAQDIVRVSSHRGLLGMASTLASRLEADPRFSVMLLANPVLALKHYGIELSPDMQQHVLRALRHPPKLRDRREALEASLEKELGEKPQPNDPAWMALLVFETRRLAPLDLSGAEPVYRPLPTQGMIDRLRKTLPPPTKRYPGKRRLKVKASIGLALRTPVVRWFDFDAAVPERPQASSLPGTLTLEEAWFYKADPVVRDAVELGQIERRAFPFRTPGGFRDVANGELVDAFRAFVRFVRIPSERT